MPRRATSLTLDRDMLEEAKCLGLNVSRAAEEGLAAALKAERTRRWKEENAEAMHAHNAFVERNGIPFARHRKF